MEAEKVIFSRFADELLIQRDGDQLAVREVWCWTWPVQGLLDHWGSFFMTSSTLVKMVVRTVAFSSIWSALLVCVGYTLKRTTVLFPCQQLAQSVCVNPNILCAESA